jgi:pSer/pThr/pTyr-binding forkhead associated (FHA) protein
MQRFSINFGTSSVELPLGDTLVGRDASCQVRLADPRVSRRHLRIRVAEDRATVEDLGSSNGTTINGERLTAVCPLRRGDALQLGGATVIEVSVSAGQPQPRPEETLEPDTLLVHASQVTGRANRPTVEAGPLQAVSTAVEHEISSDTRAQQQRAADRRRHARCASSAVISYDSDTLNLDAHARDLSDGGIFVVTEILDQVGTTCQMTIELEGSRPFRATGVVRHVVLNDGGGPHPPGMGIQFTDLSIA